MDYAGVCMLHGIVTLNLQVVQKVAAQSYKQICEQKDGHTAVIFLSMRTNLARAGRPRIIRTVSQLLVPPSLHAIIGRTVLEQRANWIERNSR